MKCKYLKSIISVLLSLLIVISFMTISFTTYAAVLEDNYEDEFEEQSKTYQDLGVKEDEYDLIEPKNNRFPIISPSSEYDQSYPPFYIGSYKDVQNYLNEKNMTDGLPIVPPTKIKAEKFLGYSSFGYNDIVANVNGKKVKAYMVAANAIMAGCSPEHLPVCIAYTQALSNNEYLNSLKSGKLTPMMYVNGPMARQIGIDNTQGMTTEETNIAIGRFIELALINLAGIKRTNAFGSVQPLVFSENDEICLNIGWQPHHVEKGYQLNDNVITATSFAMWGNNVTPATDLPEEIMKVIAWDVTEKNLGALGSASVEDNANAHRLIFITESVATALAEKYKSKSALESALIQNARRPLWMRTYAYYYANTAGALSKSFNSVYNELKNESKEDAKITASPAWMNGITYSNIETVATMTKGNTDIIITGDSSRNKSQVMPGGVSVCQKVELSSNWDNLVTSMNYNPIDTFNLSEQNHTITPPDSVPSVLTNGDYRILDPASGETYLTRPGRLYFDSTNNILYYYAQGTTSKSSITLDVNKDAAFITYINTLGYNSSISINNHKLTGATIRFSSNNSKLHNNTTSLTSDSFSGLNLSVHANNTTNSNPAGGLAKDGSSITFSDTIKSYTVNLDGTIVMGESTDSSFIKLNGSIVSINTNVDSGATAIIGAINENGTYRTMTFVNGGDGTYKVTYNTSNSLSISTTSFYLEGSFNDFAATDSFMKTGNDDVITCTKELKQNKYTFKVYNSGSNESYGYSDSEINDSTNRLTLSKGTDKLCTLNAIGGIYEFRYEISTKKLSVFHAKADAEPDPETKTIYIGVIEYIKDFIPTLRYWNNSGLLGDTALVPLSKSDMYSVGSSYWNNKKQNFIIYKAEIPTAATSIKTYRKANNDRWAEEDISYAQDKILLLFEYSGQYHNVSKDIIKVEPTTEVVTDPEIIKGDANNDGIVNIADATTIQKYLACLINANDINLKAATIMGDEISISDATRIQRYLAHIITGL